MLPRAAGFIRGFCNSAQLKHFTAMFHAPVFVIV
jgi:hypothetical protein